jgi:hypothetical protein
MKLVMIRPANNRKNTAVALTFLLILLVAAASILTSYYSKSNIKLNTQTIFNQELKQPSPSIIGAGINQTSSLNVTNSYFNSSSAPLVTGPISLNASKSTPFKQADLNQLFFFIRNNPYPPPNPDPISLDASKFSTHTYGGYSIQQPDPTQLVFSFPDNTNLGQLAGSDALTLDTFPVQKIDFDAAFMTPKIGALGFDEMVVFVTSDTSTYKGTEFGVRMDLKDGFIYGYIQEPDGGYGEVNFQMLNLKPNDGVMHHYTLILSLGSGISFCVDGLYCGYLSFPSSADYSVFNFFVLAVVHRFTDDWDSAGDTMIVENFFLNQQ